MKRARVLNGMLWVLLMVLIAGACHREKIQGEWYTLVYRRGQVKESVRVKVKKCHYLLPNVTEDYPQGYVRVFWEIDCSSLLYGAVVHAALVSNGGNTQKSTRVHRGLPSETKPYQHDDGTFYFMTTYYIESARQYSVASEYTDLESIKLEDLMFDFSLLLTGKSVRIKLVPQKVQ